MRQITEIIIHCTATRTDANCTVESIRRYHKSLGWHDIGYHYVIYPDGSVHSGRPVEEVGAHCPGRLATPVPRSSGLVTAVLPPEWLHPTEPTPSNIQAIPQTDSQSLHLYAFLRSTRSRTSDTIHLSLPV